LVSSQKDGGCGVAPHPELLKRYDIWLSKGAVYPPSGGDEHSLTDGCGWGVSIL
jgi:hypothetical protein